MNIEEIGKIAKYVGNLETASVYAYLHARSLQNKAFSDSNVKEFNINKPRDAEANSLTTRKLCRSLTRLKNHYLINWHPQQNLKQGDVFKLSVMTDYNSIINDNKGYRDKVTKPSNKPIIIDTLDKFLAPTGVLDSHALMVYMALKYLNTINPLEKTAYNDLSKLTRLSLPIIGRAMKDLFKNELIITRGPANYHAVGYSNKAFKASLETEELFAISNLKDIIVRKETLNSKLKK